MKNIHNHSITIIKRFCTNLVCLKHGQIKHIGEKYKFFKNMRCKVKNSEFKPAFQENNIAIAITSSNEYAPFLGVLLKSIVENSDNQNNYDIIVLEKSISKENKRILQDELEGKNNFLLRYIEISNYLDKYKFHTGFHITVMTYCRLLLLDILSEYSKVVYLDSDVVVNKDIASLFNIDLTGKMIAAARDSVMAGWDNIEVDAGDIMDEQYRKEQYEYNVNEIGVKNIFAYFNAGIVVMNLYEFRKKYTSRDLLTMASSTNWKWFDQDVLNKICYGKSVLLPQKWNVMCHNEEAEGDAAESMAPKSIYKEYCEAKLDPYALHYCGKTIPCYAPKVNNASMFWKYARKTEYYEEIFLRMIDCRLYSLIRTNNKSFARKVADFLLPKGTKRRSIVKFFIPRNSPQWNVLKKFYHTLAG